MKPAHAANAFNASSSELSVAAAPGQSGLFFSSLVPAALSAPIAQPPALAHAAPGAGGGAALLLVALGGLILLLKMAINSSSK